MYEVLPSFVLGFHGCDRQVAEKVITGNEKLKKSSNNYDWLGNGIYFWENNPERALDYANLLKDNPRGKSAKIKQPYVIGAVIDPGYCLNLLDSSGLREVKEAYNMLEKATKKAGNQLPENRPIEKEGDLLLRNLDCAVIELLHTYNRENNKREYDTVRGVFFEGKELYPNAGFREKNHIQLCVRNPNCIKGYFHVREYDTNFPIP